MANTILTLTSIHPVLSITVLLAFVATCFTYLAPDFTANNLVISGDLNVGTFCGTFVHLNWGHLIGNMIVLIPVWIYAEKLTGKSFVTVIVLVNMLVTGIFGLLSDSKLCGLSGVVYMLLGMTGIMGNWLVFGVAAILFVGEFTLLSRKDNTSHIAHIIFCIIGIGIGIAKIALLK